MFPVTVSWDESSELHMRANQAHAETDKLRDDPH
jgi:hypothetical protein